MKIVQIIDQLGLGGAERVCVNLANILHRNGNSVKVVVIRNDGELFDLIDEGIEVVILNKQEGKRKAYKKFVDSVKDDDIIHAHMRVTYRFVRKAFLFYGGAKPVILHDHYGKIVVDKSVPKFYTSFFKPSFYIGCSKLLTSWAVDKVKIDDNKVFLVNNFVLKSNVEKTIKKGEGLVLVGTLKKVKNHKLAIDIAIQLQKELSIYCSSYDVKDVYYKELIKYLRVNKYEDKVRFITGCKDVQKEFYNYEAALLTSTSEGDPLAIVEYLAQGIPFLCSNVGEAVKVIKKEFPFIVQDDFVVENWVKNYNEVMKIDIKDINELYDAYFSSEIYLNKYLDIYSKFMLTYSK